MTTYTVTQRPTSNQRGLFVLIGSFVVVSVLMAFTYEGLEMVQGPHSETSHASDVSKWKDCLDKPNTLKQWFAPATGGNNAWLGCTEDPKGKTGWIVGILVATAMGYFIKTVFIRRQGQRKEMDDYAERDKMVSVESCPHPVARRRK